MTPREWRYILHADLDAFYASVEQMDNPQYRGRPVVVGGSPEERGVVAAASYEARRYNVRSAMPMRTALRLCPELVRVAPRFGRYRELSGMVMDLFLELTPLVEPMSLDEAFLDVTAVAAWDGVNAAAVELRARVLERTGLVVSIGGGTSKTVAKVASQLSKPNGLLLVAPGTEQEFLAPLNAGILSGVGAKTAETLSSHGVATLGDLASRDAAWLRTTFGRRGPELRERAMGIDDGEVTRHRETKSVSSEETMTRDTGEESELVQRVEELARGVASRLQAPRAGRQDDHAQAAAGGLHDAYAQADAGLADGGRGGDRAGRLRPAAARAGTGAALPAGGRWRVRLPGVAAAAALPGTQPPYATGRTAVTGPGALTLSKSRFMAGLQCLKRLYLETYARHLADPRDPASQAVLDSGTRVGELARQRFPGGVLIR